MERKIITERVKAGIERKKSVSKRRGQAGIAHAAQAIVLVVQSLPWLSDCLSSLVLRQSSRLSEVPGHRSSVRCAWL